MPFTTTVTGVDQVITRMRGRIQVLQDLQPSLVVGAQEFGAIEERHFSSEGDGKWAPLTAGTREYKGQESVDGSTLVRSGALRGQLTKPLVLEMSSTSIRLGTNLPYAKFHQKGFRQVWGFTRSRDGHLVLRRRARDSYTPARKPVDLSAEDRRMISYRVALDVRRRLRGVG